MEKDFGKFLSEKRKEVGLTQKELGEKLFVSESAVSKWEKNKSRPDISMVNELAKILNVTEHEILSSSIDHEERKRKKDAKKWRTLITTFDLFFIIAYSITIFTCFICNLAVNKTLSWFFIVLTAVLLGASFTTLPRYIKNNKLLILSITPLVLTILLFFVCNAYVGGNWFIIATLPTLYLFIVIFLPLYYNHYIKNKKIIKYLSLINIIFDIILLALLLDYISFFTNGNWQNTFAIPLLGLCAFVAILFVVVIKFLAINRWYKSSILTFVFIPFILCGYILTKALCKKVFDIEITKIAFPNLTNWTSDVMINSNVCFLIVLSLLVISLVFLTLGVIKQKKEM